MISNEIFLFLTALKSHALRSIHQPEDLKSTPHRNSAVRRGVDQVSRNALWPTSKQLPLHTTAAPSGHVYTAWMADQVVVHSSHISILVSRHRAINVVGIWSSYHHLAHNSLQTRKPGPKE